MSDGYRLRFYQLRMYCIDTEALVFMFNGGSPYGFTIPPINNKKHVHHGFLAPQPYLCSTSLNYVLNGNPCKLHMADKTEITDNR